MIREGGMQAYGHFANWAGSSEMEEKEVGRQVEMAGAQHKNLN